MNEKPVHCSRTRPLLTRIYAYAIISLDGWEMKNDPTKDFGEIVEQLLAG